MVSTLCLLTCALAIGQVTDRGDWLLVPQLSRGQELIYSGTFNEKALGPNVQFERTFSIDATVLVLDAAVQQFNMAFLTTVSPRSSTNPREPGSATQPPSSVRLEVMAMDRQGKLKPALPNVLTIPIEGPPTIECGVFHEMPKGKVDPTTSWEANDEGRTPWAWRVDGTEMVNNVHCVRMVGVQQSAEWATPRADAKAWQRRDTLWISPQLGLTYRYERVVDRRDAAHETATHRSVLRVDLESNLTYAGKMYDDRKNEIDQARKWVEEANPLLRDAEKHKSQLEALHKRIKQCTATDSGLTYRKAVVQLQKRIEAGLRGETVPDPQMETGCLDVPRVALGQRMPDFVCSDLLTHQTHRLQRLLGKPVLVVFYNPATPTGLKTLGFALAISQRCAGKVNFMVMAITDDEELVQRQRKEMKLPFPILDGNGVLGLFAVDATPRFVVLDGQGIARGTWTGWGIHTSSEIQEQLQKWMAK
jgi:peroxiredoxin